MTRLSLSPEPEEWKQGRYRLNLDDSDTDGEYVSVSSPDDCEYSSSDSEDDEDYPHPKGFPGLIHPSWGRTRFCLDPSATPDSIEEQWEEQTNYVIVPAPTTRLHRFMQSYPPMESYVDPKTASTASLLQYEAQIERKKNLQKENDKEMEQLARLFQASSIANRVKLLGPPEPSNDPPLSSFADTPYDIKKKMEMEKQRLEKDNKRAAEALKQLLDNNQRQADQILKNEKERLAAEDKARDEEERRKQAQADAENQARREKEDREREQEKKAQEAKQQAEDAEAAEAAEKAKKSEYLVRAKKLVAQLQTLRQSIEPFEQSKAVGKRRLNMKKVVRGKVNTLSENVEKIKSVALDVGQAITAARAEDEELKKQIQAGNSQITPEMTRGKRYLLDLLASSIMVRVQAEGFNGLRGDGFPIANMLALVSLENKDLCPILEAHIYTVCPTAIPKLPTPSSDASEEALMESLGMAKDKKGEYETFSRFLLRTEGIISLVADIMASNPPTHKLLGGHKGAVDWLERFLAIIPAAPHSPLPLLTAPVLDAFLTGAGHMLANKHAEEFRKHLEVIQDDIVNRLDEGPIGQPSATRLKRTIKDGFAGLKNNLPSKALKELYYGSDSSDGNVSLPPAGAQAANQTQSNPFGGGPSTNAPPNPFGGPATSQSSAGSNPFGGGPTSTGTTGQAPPNPFGTSTSSGGGTSSGGSSGFGTGPSTFGASNTASNPSPFGAPASAAANPSPFGAPSPAPGAGNPSPFGAPSPAPQSSFGSFGTSATTRNNNSMQDESNANQNSNNPFGGPGPGTQSSTPFGNSSAATPFGQPAAGASNPFGTSSSAGGGFGAPSSNPSPFGSPAPAPGSAFGTATVSNSTPNPFGSSNNSNPSPFGAGSNSNPSPFGANNSNPSPFGANNSNPSPFGSFSSGTGNAQQQSPFGGQQQSSGFGGNSGGQGNTDNRPPCKFFQRGQCRYGDKCRFSHGNQNQGGGGGNNSTFGRRF